MTTSTHTLPSSTPSVLSKLSLKSLLSTDDQLAPALIRIALGGVMLPHGAQKLLGWFGGYGFEGTMGYLTQQVGLPWIVALIVILLESLGALALILGVGARYIAAGYIGLMVGAIFTAHLKFGFFMNWSGQQGGEGFEFHILMIAMAAALLASGAGKWSLDAHLTRLRSRA